ncbi:MAG: DUF3782 domain-containing protein, partial [Candidatus Jordarchaeales archaeon]
ILKRMDKLEENQIKLWENINKLWEEVRSLREGQNRLWESVNKLWEEVKSLREGQNRLWDEVRSLREGQEKLWEEVRSLREGQNKLWEEVRSLREGQNKLWEEVRSLREGQNKLWEEVRSLREDFSVMNRKLDALGARWGIMAEECFRESLRGILEKEFGFRVERWIRTDHEGYVFGYKEQVEIDLAISDGKVILVEVTSHAKISDVFLVKRKAEFYSKVEGRKVDRLIIVSPYADDKAKTACITHGVELYTV